MSNSTRRERGLAMMKRVYAGDVVTPPAGVMPFSDLMLEQLWAEVWTREDALSIRDRRLVIMGIIAALGERETFGIQAKAAVKTGDLTPDQVREILITVANYAGYPRAAGLIAPTEQALAQAAKDLAK